MRRSYLCGLMLLALPSTFGSALAACASQTLTVSLVPSGLSTTRCLSAADLTSLQAALGAPLIAAGNPSPSGAQEWAEAVQIMVDALNTFALQYLTRQSQSQAPVVTYVGMQ